MCNQLFINTRIPKILIHGYLGSDVRTISLKAKDELGNAEELNSTTINGTNERTKEEQN